MCSVLSSLRWAGRPARGVGVIAKLGLPRSIRPPDPRPQEVASGRALLPLVASAPVPPPTGRPAGAWPRPVLKA